MAGTDTIAWIALGLSALSTATSIAALVETYRHRLRPEFVFDWCRFQMTHGDEPWCHLLIANQSEAVALDVRVTVDTHHRTEDTQRLGPSEALSLQIPAFRARTIHAGRSDGDPDWIVPVEGDYPSPQALVRPSVTLTWREEPNTRKVRRCTVSAPDDALVPGTRFLD